LQTIKNIFSAANHLKKKKKKKKTQSSSSSNFNHSSSSHKAQKQEKNKINRIKLKKLDQHYNKTDKKKLIIYSETYQ
jgi:dethiobiotin synthetase